MNHVVVTGGAGYIGSHVCKSLAAAGFVPITFDNLSCGHEDAVRWGPFVRGDVLDRPALDAVFQVWRPIAVMHFAAFAYVGESVDNPGKYYRNNVAGSLNLLEAMRDHGVNRLVFSSSCAIYGSPSIVPIDESHVQNPINPYGASKSMIERMIRDFDMAHGLRSISLRYFNVAGADPDGEAGESHYPETHLIPLVLNVVSGERRDIVVFGDDYDTPDGTCIRDYIHVTDLASAHVLALAALNGGANTTAYNLGNGRGFSVRQVIDMARRVTEKEIPVLVGPRRLGDSSRLVGDATMIQSELGWQPRHVDLADMIGTAWAWHRKINSSR